MVTSSVDQGDKDKEPRIQNNWFSRKPFSKENLKQLNLRF
jgi:hypothetical protein